MLQHVTEVRHLGKYRLFVAFNDGQSGEIDLGPLLQFHGVFDPLRDEREFARVRVDGESIGWPGGADVAPETLYEWVTGRSWGVDYTAEIARKRESRPNT